MPPLPSDAWRPLQIMAGAFLLSSALLLAAGAALGPLGGGPVDPTAARTLAAAAAGWAVLSPLVAALLTRGGDQAVGTPSLDDMRHRFILRFALLESGVTLAAVALFLGPLRWPLYGALVPLLAMVAAFPREH